MLSLLSTGAALLALSPLTLAQAAPGAERRPTQDPPRPAEAPAADADAKRAEREAAFAKLLTNARLEGFTTLSNQEGLKPDSYTLERVSKQRDGRWRFEAIIHFGGRPAPIAVDFPVEWAGDTPVVSVTSLTVPFMGTYDARVLFHGDQYVGVWSGKGYGGHIFGKVVPATSDAPADEGGGQDGGGATEDGGVSAENRSDGAAEASASWPSFRGRNAAGVADGHPLPATFDVASGENVLWRVPVPGLAHSSPVIFGDKLFVTTAIRLDGEQPLRVGLYGDIAPVEDESEFRFEVHAYDKRTGERLWERTAWQGVPAIKRHTKGSHAASTPACDGERVVAFFGSEGLYCFDHDGKPLWSVDFGVLDSGYHMVKKAQWGFASSPVLHDGKVIVQCDVQEGSFLAVLDARDGKEIWRKSRDEKPGWSTPTVHVSEAGGVPRAQIVCNGWKHIGGYDLATGEEIWRAAPGGDIPVPTPVVAHELIYITNAHGGPSPMLAISTAAEGRVSLADDERRHLAWGRAKGGNYMQTPLVYGDVAYFCRDNGVLTAVDARTGAEHYSERLDSGRAGYTGSGVAGDGKLYFTSEEGTVQVLEAGPVFKVLARNSLGEEFMSTPAISEGVIYFRSKGHLTAVASPRE